MGSNGKLNRKAYERAEKFLPWNAYKLTFNTYLQPNWIDKTDRFWYASKKHKEKKFILIDPDKGIKENAFDHIKLAITLSNITGISYNPQNLPIEEIKFIDKGQFLQFDIKKKRYIFNLVKYECKERKRKKNEPQGELKSPDGKWAVYIKNHNVYARSLSHDTITQLTKDGEKHYDYGLLPESSTYEITIRRFGIKLPPVALWSPDSRKIVIHKLDQRKVKELHLIQSVGLERSLRPRLHSYSYPLPGDRDVPQAELIILDIENKNKVVVKYKPQCVSNVPPIFSKYVWWSNDSNKIFFIYLERDFKTGKLCETNTLTGETREIIEEHVSTQIDFTHFFLEPPNVKILNNGNEIIWFSQRDGWGHLYLYDGESGNLKNQITSGSWLVHKILYVDERSRWVYFLAGGREKDRDPYYGFLYRASLEGEIIELLTPENADHDIIFSPTGKYFIDNFSRVDTTPISILRAADGKLIFNLENADLSLLLKENWKSPKQFKVKARDGIIDLYGLIFFPTTFDSSKKYPVIDYIYPGPQRINTNKSFPQKLDKSLRNFWEPQSMAEVGFIIITLDGMGTPLRSKTFHDYSYGNMSDAGGLEDHVTAIKQLAREHSYMDLNRVGIYGHSGGGFASARAILQYPDFYKVAVSSAGNHDQRGYVASWGEKYQGMLDGDNYMNQVNAKLAKNLKGYLLLAWGDMDDNVHPALTLQLVDALIKANKDFDLLVLPNRNHMFSLDSYFIRKRWDYFVQHLLELKPPKEYKIKGPSIAFVMKMYMI
ncbi:MAG: DPP IV N-terminal domain-containing protein [Candidatus Hodarchaeota archaeon]